MLQARTQHGKPLSLWIPTGIDRGSQSRRFGAAKAFGRNTPHSRHSEWIGEVKMAGAGGESCREIDGLRESVAAGAPTMEQAALSSTGNQYNAGGGRRFLALHGGQIDSCCSEPDQHVLPEFVAAHCSQYRYRHSQQRQRVRGVRSVAAQILLNCLHPYRCAIPGRVDWPDEDIEDQITGTEDPPLDVDQ